MEYQSSGIFRSEGGKSKTIHKYELYVVLDISFLQLMYLNMNGEDYIIRHNLKNGTFPLFKTFPALTTK